MGRDNRLLALSMLLWGFGEGLFAYLHPLYMRELGADPATIGFIQSLGSAVGMLAMLPSGFLVDRLGPKFVLCAGWVIGLGSELILFAAPNLTWYAVGWVIYAFTYIVSVSITAYAVAARGSLSVQAAITTVSASFFTGMIVAPTLGGVLADHLGIRSVFGIAAIFLFISTVIIFLITPRRVHSPAAGLNRYRGLMRNKRFWGFLALMLATLTGLYLTIPLSPNFLEEVRGMDFAVVGLLGSANALGYAALNLTLGRRTPRLMFVLGIALVAGFSILMLATGHVVLLMLGFFLRGGWNLTINMSNAIVGHIVEPTETGLAFGFTGMTSSLSMMVGAAAAGLLYARQPALPFIVNIVAVIILVPVAWLVTRAIDMAPEAKVRVEATLTGSE